MGSILKKLDIIFIQKRTNAFQKISSDIRLAQERLEGMLAAIDSNFMDYNKGRISKELFEENDTRLKKESAKLLKKINTSVDTGIKLIEEIIKQMETQKM